MAPLVSSLGLVVVLIFRAVVDAREGDDSSGDGGGSRRQGKMKGRDNQMYLFMNPGPVVMRGLWGGNMGGKRSER